MLLARGPEVRIVGSLGAWSRFMGFVAIAGVLAGCGAADDGTGDEEDLTGKAPSAEEAKACQQGTVKKDAKGDTVVHCTMPFDAAPHVRLPDDSLGGTTVKLYAGVTLPTDFSGAFVLWSRTGERYVPVDSNGDPIQFNSGTKLPKALHAPTNRITFTFYQFAGKLGASIMSPHGDATAIRLTSARPVVEIDGCAFDSRLLGTFDGTVSKRLKVPGMGQFAKSFDENSRAPIHVTLSSITADPVLDEYSGGKVSDAATYKLSGQIDNFASDVKADGKTYKSLAALGKENPFLGATDGKVELYRLGNMHGQKNDGHWVLTYPSGSEALTGNGMSYTLTAFTAPAFLFDEGVSDDAIDTAEIRPHIPYAANGHSVLLSPVAVGEHMGQCPK